MSAAVLAVLLTATVAQPPTPRPALVVVVDQETQVPLRDAQLRALDREVGHAWSAYANVMVRDGRRAVPTAADDVLTLVITDRLSSSGDGVGWIQFVDGEPSHTIYVSEAMAARLVAEGQVGGRRIAYWPPKVRETFLVHAIALAVAHEVGHYLLRSKAHASSGLMRARFTVDDFMHGPPAAAGLDRVEQVELQQRIRGYLMARGSTQDQPMP
jgi:hypothetical protein